MIQYQRHHASAARREVRIKVVGLGGAGGNVLDRVQLDGLSDVDLIAINTDMQALTASVAPEKIQLGRNTTRGLGAGGDPEVGYSAAEEAFDEIRQALEGAELVLLCVGLGGGTGSGAARIVASLARDQKAHVVALVTLPFAFEGKRRRAQAEEALGALRRYSDVVIHFENDRMADSVAPLAGIQEAFSTSDHTLSSALRALANLARQRGLINIGFDELMTALRGSADQGAYCVFGHGEASGDNRAHEALSLALKNPLMDKGRMLEDARNLLVNVVGGPSMTLNEVQILMEELNRHISDQTRLLFGAAIDPAYGNKMGVTLMSALDGAPAATIETRTRPSTRVESSPVSVAPTPATPPPRAEPAPAPRVEAVIPPARVPEPEPEPEPVHIPEPEPVIIATASVEIAPAFVEPPVVEREPEPEPEPVPAPRFERADRPERVERVERVERAPEPEPEPVYSEPIPEPSRHQAPAPAPRPVKNKPVLAKQEQMQFEPVTRGRFEKSEPTIVDGQDLDVPTFLRRNVKVK